MQFTRDIAIVIILAVVVGWGIYGMVVDRSSQAKRAATAWAAEVGVSVKGISCASHDTDNDGYVSCSLQAADGEIVALECHKFHDTCRLQKARY